MERGTVFEFDSGGPVHFSPYGVWAIKLDAARGLAITHNVFGQVTDYGRVTLAEDEAEALWTAVRALDIPHLESSTRMPVPDEGAFTFILDEGAQRYKVQIWRGDALKDARIAALVAEIGAAITRATGKQPVLR